MFISFRYAFFPPDGGVVDRYQNVRHCADFLDRVVGLREVDMDPGGMAGPWAGKFLALQQKPVMTALPRAVFTATD